MNSKEIFTLAVRLLGLFFLYLGLQALPAAFGQIIMLLGTRVDMSLAGFVVMVVTTGWPFFVASWLLRGAPRVMRLAYPETETMPPRRA